MSRLICSIALLALAACNGGGAGSTGGGGYTYPGESTAYQLQLSGYSPTGGGSTTNGLNSLQASLSTPASDGLVTLQGQLLPIRDGDSDGQVYNFGARINESTATVVDLFDLPPNLPRGVYDFYAILHNRNTGDTYGGVVRNWAIQTAGGGSQNQVIITLFPVLESVTNVRDFRLLADEPPLLFSYDPTQVGSTRPKLVVTLSDGTQLSFLIDTSVSNPADDLPANTVRVFISGGDSSLLHRFYYGHVSIVAPSDGSATNDPTPVLQYTIDDPCFPAGTCGESVLVDGTTVSARNGDPLPSLNDGQHIVKVIYSDPEGHSEVTQFGFLVDATPPVIEVGGTSGGGTGGGTGTGTIEDSGTLDTNSGQLDVTTDEQASLSIYLDPDATCQAEIDSGSPTDCSGFLVDSQFVASNQVLSAQVIGLLPGPHRLFVVAVDNLGNQSVKIINFTVIDTTAPDVQIAAPDNGVIYDSRTVPFTYTVSDDVTPVANIQVSVGVEHYDPSTATWAAAAATIGTGTLTVGSDGRFRVTVTATNGSGLSSSVYREFRVDTTPPAVQITSPVDGSTVYTNKPQLTVQSTEDNLFQTQIYLVEGLVAPGDAPVYDSTNLLNIHIDGLLQEPDGQPLTDGDYTVVVVMTDAVNHTTATWSSFTVNAVAPYVKIINPAAGAVITNGKVNLKYNVHDASQVEVWVTGPLDPNPSVPALVHSIVPVQPVPKTYQDTIDVPVDGNYTISVVATDATLPTAQSEDHVSFMVDGHRPSVSITSPSDGTLYVKRDVAVPVVFQTSDAYEYEVLVGSQVVQQGTLDGTPASITVNLDPFTADSTQTVKVQVSDAQSESSDSFVLVVDGTAPVVTIQSPQSGQTLTGTSATLLYTVTESNGIAGQQVWLDGQLQDGTGSGTTFIDLVPGSHTLAVNATDRAGNVSETASVTFQMQADDPAPDPDPGHDHGHHRHGHTSCLRSGLPHTDGPFGWFWCVRHHHGN